MRSNFQTIDEYIKTSPAEVQNTLEKIRKTIRKAAPDAEEVISYQIPTFKWHGNLVHFAVFKNHIGFYPTPGAIEAFREELSAYQISKGTVRFPLNEPVPFKLISKITKYRIKINLEKANRSREKSGILSQPAK